MLESYKPNERLIEQNWKKIEDEKRREIPAMKGKVIGSSSEFPYTKKAFTVEMDDPVESGHKYQRIRRWEQEIERAEQENTEIEQFINGIQDRKDREIFQYRYIDGMRAKDVGDTVGYTKGRVSQIIKKYLKD